MSLKPIDTKTGEPWPTEYSIMAHRQIREQCTADLRRRDEARGIVGGKVTRTISNAQLNLDGGTEQIRGDTKDVPDYALIALKHTGDDTIRLLAKRWAEFCSVKQDLAAFIKKTKMPDQKEIEAARAAAADLEESIPKKRGRPVGSGNNPKVPDMVTTGGEA